MIGPLAAVRIGGTKFCKGGSGMGSARGTGGGRFCCKVGARDCPGSGIMGRAQSPGSGAPA